jgi:Holliday junction resolvase RusA-like endonuclease
MDPFVFVPLVTAEMSAVAELSVVLLRPEPAGQLLTQGGDIDNRLKTLFDALTMPRHARAAAGLHP